MNHPAPPPLQTRKPTGLPSWPIGLVAGVEKSGKTLKLVEATASDLIHHTYWIGCGEDDPDEYGAFPGARFDIVLHDGTYRGILGAIEGAKAQPPGPNGEPNLLAFDSGTRAWDLLKDMAQATQHERFAKKAERQGGSVVIPDEGIKPTPDLWNLANDRWDHIMDALREHDGPVLITSRLDLQMVVDAEGRPTKEKRWNVLSQKRLTYDVGFIVQMRGAYPESENYLTGVRSLRYQHQRDRNGKAKLTPLGEDFTIDGIWRALGLDEAVAARVHSRTVALGDQADRHLADHRTALLNQVKAVAEAVGVPLPQIAEEWAQSHGGQRINETTDVGGLELLLDDLKARPLVRAAEQAIATEESPSPAAAEEPAVAPGLPPEVADLLETVLTGLAEARSESDLRAVWEASEPVRSIVVENPRHGRLTVGELIYAVRDEHLRAAQQAG